MAVPDALLIVEGPHDAEFVARLLKAAGYDRVTEITDLPNEWRKLVPTTFPKSGRGINQPHEAPQFRLSGTGDLVMTLISGGDTKLAEGFAAALDSLGRSPAAVGFVLDDDRQPIPHQRHTTLIESAKEIVGETMPAFPIEPGIIIAGPPRTGVFVFPDNQTQGSLEDVLLEAGRVAYPKLLAHSASFVDGVDRTELTPEDLREGNKNAGPKKQTVSAVTAILKPTRALATSLQDNRWLSGKALERPLVARFRVWLHDLLHMPAPPAME